MTAVDESSTDRDSDSRRTRSRTWLAMFTLSIALGVPRLAAGQCLDYFETEFSTDLASLTSVVVSPDGKNLYASAYSVTNPFIGYDIVTFTRDPATGDIHRTQTLVNGYDVQGIERPMQIAVSPDNKSVYVASRLGNSVAVFSRDTSAGGDLTFVETKIDGVDGVSGLRGAQWVDLSADGVFVYVAAGSGSKFREGTPGDDSIVIFRRDPATSRLTFVQAVVDGVDGVTGLSGVHAARVSPDGKHVYAVSQVGAGGVLTWFARNATTGMLTFLGKLTGTGALGDGLYGLSSLTITADGKSVITTELNAPGALGVFARDPGTGQLTHLETTVLPGDPSQSGNPITVEASPDSANVYAALYNSGVAVFSRDTTTGHLTYRGDLTEAESSVGLSNANSVFVSPDGKQVYVGASASNAVLVFSTSNNVDGCITKPKEPCTRDGRLFQFCGPCFRLGRRGCWFDPPIAVGYDYAVTPGTGTPNFASVMFPKVGGSSFSLYLIDPSSGTFAFDSTIPALSKHDFPPGGVDRFRVLGIQGGLDPSNPEAFMTSLDFVDDGSDPEVVSTNISMTPLVECSEVPGSIPTAMHVKKVQMGYGKTGPGANDDAISIVTVTFTTPADFNLATTNDLSINVTDVGTNTVLFNSKLVAASGRWVQPKPTKKTWKYKDAAKPPLAGVSSAQLSEKPPGSGIYQLKLSGKGISIAGPPALAVVGVDVTLQITGNGVGVCQSASFNCANKAAKDQCAPTAVK